MYIFIGESINKPVTRQEISIGWKTLSDAIVTANLGSNNEDKSKLKDCIRIMTARWHVNARRPWLYHVKMMPPFSLF